MTLVRFWLTRGRDVVDFTACVSDDAIAACYRLPRDADRIGFWRGVTGDSRLEGHAMVWEPLRA